MRILFLVVALLWGYIVNIFAQESAPDTLYLSSMKLPIPAVDSTVPRVYLLAHPLRHPKTPGNKYRAGDWVRVDLSKYPGVRVPIAPRSDIFVYERLESRFIYTQNPQKSQEYKFYYRGEEGELVSEEEFKSIKFLKFPAVKKLLLPYDITPPILYDKELGEVYRWQHPNLYVVVYDKNRKGYYRYRIALVIYHDDNHPKAYQILE